ncbi:uncharacterized protein LOC143576789 [Bidens hawaiensis]|uniref:uncharacterized protein LOC143576789 n=1 Tax=Bidens hawaiensis TaxID=980011 RepID=UPI004049AFD7
MEAQTFTMLNDIDVLKTSTSTLKVRVLRLWSIKDNKNVKEDFLIEMVLMDEDENRIQATVYKHDIFRFKRILKESSTLTIVNPSVGLNGSNYRVIDFANKLVLGPNTHVNPCQDFEGRMFGFKMISFESISLVTSFMSSRAMFQTSKTKTSLSKYVVDHFDEAYAIIVLQFSRVKYYTGSDGKEKVYVSNAFGSNVSRFFINDFLFEIEEYKNILLGLLNGNDVGVRKPIPVKMLSSVDDDFLKATNLFNICDTCPKNIIILGTIKAICPDTECFKIKIRVQDPTRVVSLTLFDRDAKMLINKTATELIDSQKETGSIN